MRSVDLLSALGSTRTINCDGFGDLGASRHVLTSDSPACKQSSFVGLRHFFLASELLKSVPISSTPSESATCEVQTVNAKNERSTQRCYLPQVSLIIMAHGMPHVVDYVPPCLDQSRVSEDSRQQVSFTKEVTKVIV
jgi:hypothetical protein